uniref:Uncharacterized protein n=1 Tax=Peronospora matthiolae TaxID=2874970 RepID=A0AAV1TSS3_9STRA
MLQSKVHIPALYAVAMAVSTVAHMLESAETFDYLVVTVRGCSCPGVL